VRYNHEPLHDPRSLAVISKQTWCCLCLVASKHAYKGADRRLSAGWDSFEEQRGLCAAEVPQLFRRCSAQLKAHRCSGDALQLKAHRCSGDALQLNAHRCSGDVLQLKVHICLGDVLQLKSRSCSGDVLCSWRPTDVQEMLCSWMPTDVQEMFCSWRPTYVQEMLCAAEGPQMLRIGSMQLNSHSCSGERLCVAEACSCSGEALCRRSPTAVREIARLSYNSLTYDQHQPSRALHPTPSQFSPLHTATFCFLRTAVLNVAMCVAVWPVLLLLTWRLALLG
jgi:hypothetical protein